MMWLEANGGAVRCEVSGPDAAGQSVVLVHEMGGTLDSWDDVAPVLAQSHRVLRYDMRGFGMSGKLRGTGAIDTLADDLVAVMDATGLPGRAVLAGSAVGAGVALHVAARCPGRVAGVVAMSPVTQVPAERRAAYHAMADRMERDGMSAIADESHANSYPPALRGDPARFAAFRARWLGNDPGSFAATYRMLVELDLSASLAALRCPVLVVGATNDPLRPPAASEAVARAIPGARFQVAETGHFAAVQTPALVASLLLGFMRDLVGGGPAGDGRAGEAGS